MQKGSEKSLIEELTIYSRELISIKSRLYFLQAIDLEMRKHLDAVTGQIPVRNWQVYDVLHSTHSHLIIDLCSYCAHFAENGGLIRQLNNHLSKLKPANPKDIQVNASLVFSMPGDPYCPEADARVGKAIAESKRERISDATKRAMGELFPDLKLGEKVTQKNVDRLRSRFKSAIENIDIDRNTHRAHRFENQSRKQAQAVKPLTLTEVKEAFSKVEDLLGNLWMIAKQATYIFDTNISSGTEHTAEDLVDLMVFGSVGKIVENVGIPEALEKLGSQKTWYWEFRKINKGRDNANIVIKSED